MTKQNQILIFKIDGDIVVGEVFSETDDEYFIHYPLNINMSYAVAPDGSADSQIVVTKNFPFAAKNIVSFNKNSISSYSLPNSHISNFYQRFVKNHSKQLDTFMNDMLYQKAKSKVEIVPDGTIH